MVFRLLCTRRLAKRVTPMLLLWPMLSQATLACVHEVTLAFTESAPRDNFEIRNASSSGQRIQRLTLDLSSSAGRLIFDTSAGGTGVDVFQPFRVELGEAKLRDMPSVQDGSDRLTLDFSRFEPGQRFRFSIDVDDQLTASDLGQIRVSGQELEGALLTAVIGQPGGVNAEVTARMDGSNRAQGKAACP